MKQETIIAIAILCSFVALAFGCIIGMKYSQKLMYNLLRMYPTMFVEEWLRFFGPKNDRREV